MVDFYDTAGPSVFLERIQPAHLALLAMQSQAKKPVSRIALSALHRGDCHGSFHFRF